VRPLIPRDDPAASTAARAAAFHGRIDIFINNAGVVLLYSSLLAAVPQSMLFL
jgi:NAD(P)-dependent dehydrogenase (short-subunit alcohol dehydrogenase family)